MAVPAWLLTHNPCAAHNFFFIAAFALSSVTAHYLVRYLTGDWRPARCRADVCLLSVRVRAAGAQPVAADRLSAVGDAGLPSLHRSRVGGPGVRAGRGAVADRPRVRLLRIFAGGMVALGTIFLGVTRGLWKQPRYWVWWRWPPRSASD